MMKKLVAAGFLLVAFSVKGQQTHQYTQYLFNQFGHNPAVAGSTRCVDIRLGGRQQWLGVEGAPLTMFASVQGRLRFKKKTVIKGYHGLGLYLQRDDQGPIGRTLLYPAYAYHVRIANETNLGMGVFGGFQQFRFDRTRLTVPDGPDPALGASTSVYIIPDLSAGLWLYSKKAYAGLGVLQLLRRKIPNVGQEARITPHFNLTAGYLFAGKGNYEVIPSFMLKYVPLSMPSADLNVMFDYHKNIGFGVTYRVLDSFAGIVRFRFLRYFALGYSFDLTTTKMRWGSLQTHEISFGISGCPGSGRGEGIICPAYR